MKNKISKIFISFFLILLGFPLLYGQETNNETTLVLTGASFAVSVNGWFEAGCKKLKVNGINRAKGGTAISDLANQMARGVLYNESDLEKIDALIIMHVVNRDVFDESELKESYLEYETPFDRSNYSAAFDFVIKKYKAMCYNLKFNEKSKYFGTKHGKPAVIVLCTDWHDGRAMYNSSIRKLASKWGLPLVEFDKNIGFSKQTLHPITGKQTSLLYSKDTQTIDGELFGWHPLRGQQEYIQQRMSSIFVSTMQKILPFQNDLFEID